MDCIFRKIIAKEIPCKILGETSSSISFHDAFPLAKGHALVIPKNHHQKIQDMSSDENTDLFSLVHKMMIFWDYQDVSFCQRKCIVK